MKQNNPTTPPHPVVPPPQLVREWNKEAKGTLFEPYGYSEFITNRAAQWGADQELEACCEYLVKRGQPFTASDLRATHRPKPPSLKKQALEQLDGIAAVFRFSHGGDLVCDTIRRALETLND